jgi:hypothetical protein
MINIFKELVDEAKENLKNDVKRFGWVRVMLLELVDILFISLLFYCSHRAGSDNRIATAWVCGFLAVVGYPRIRNVVTNRIGNGPLASFSVFAFGLTLLGLAVYFDR